MKNILHNFDKILFAGALISIGISLPMMLSTGHFLECQPDFIYDDKPADFQPTASCEILEIRGGTLLTKGTQVIDRYFYRQIRRAEVVTIKGSLTSSTKRMPLERLVFVFAKGKQTVDFRLNVGMADNISIQINNLIANPQAQKFSIDVGQAAFMPQIGWVLVAGGVLVFFTKPSPPIVKE
jgi:hypothetical protein